MAHPCILFLMMYLISFSDTTATKNDAEIFKHFDIHPLNASGISFEHFNPEVMTSTTSSCLFPADCRDVLNCGAEKSGVYHIFPLRTAHGFLAYCDMVTQGGGWLVFQRRQDGSVDFYRKWQSYKDGFGNLYGEFWLGLEKIHYLTKLRETELLVNLGRFDGNTGHAKYRRFRIADEEEKFRLLVESYSGTAGNSMDRQNGMAFSTHDRDSDKWPSNCAEHYHGAWWHNACFQSNLNGLYLQRGESRGELPEPSVVTWHTWLKKWEPLQFVEMKIRPVQN